MKFSMKMAILSMAGVLALGGAATAASFIFTGDTKSDTITADNALILKWGTGTNAEGITGLTSSQPQYRELNVDWSASQKLTGPVTMTLTLTDPTSLLVVEVASEKWGLDTTADVTLSTAEGFSAEETITVVSDVSSSLASNKTFYLKISLKDGSSENTALSATLTASLGHSVEEVNDETVGG